MARAGGSLSAWPDQVVAGRGWHESQRYNLDSRLVHGGKGFYVLRRDQK